MTDSKDTTPSKTHHTGSTPFNSTAGTTTPAADVENQTGSTGGTGFGIAGILRRWKREDLLKRGYLALRGLAFLFSVLAFIVMASNKHDDWKKFDRFEEYRYVLAIAILSTLYTGLQALRQVHELSTARYYIQRSTSNMIDFFGDQITAYLLISSASSAIPLTNRLRESQDDIFTDSSAAAISMSFLAFFALALSSLISGYKLSNQASYV
ncbi:CASP-like protein 4B1 [Ziziphus jujuba]|uniref:CASP-like protein n=1 Tax=Ziziphus jujuba TaxID=326968 RepID=A0A6P4AN58_ZIZJJ|nr:CASP-like protein 4B1 [Ziziphus jujuba]